MRTVRCSRCWGRIRRPARPASRSSTTGGRRRPGCRSARRLDAVDLDAATRLASLVPADVGSSAVSLAVVVTDENGFVLDTRPKGWSAVFGFYTPSLRTTELIPGQVRLLRSLLAGREQLVDRVILASETDGTYTPRATPVRQAEQGTVTGAVKWQTRRPVG